MPLFKHQYTSLNKQTKKHVLKIKLILVTNEYWNNFVSLVPPLIPCTEIYVNGNLWQVLTVSHVHSKVTQVYIAYQIHHFSMLLNDNISFSVFLDIYYIFSPELHCSWWSPSKIGLLDKTSHQTSSTSHQNFC